MAEDGDSPRWPDEHLRILTPSGQVKNLARNAMTRGEFAGVCLSPDGRALFVNMQSDGLTLVKRIRAGGSEAGILFLTARDAPVDRIEGLDAGADDYIVKPFDMDELNARLRAVLRRPGKRLATVLEAGNLRFDASQRRASVDGQAIDLTRQEAALLELLLRRQDTVVKREEIQRSLYGFDDEVTPNAVDAAISRLRKRLRVANPMA